MKAAADIPKPDWIGPHKTFDDASLGPMLLLEDSHGNGPWLFRHNGEDWYSYRAATPRDLEVLEQVRQAKNPTQLAPQIYVHELKDPAICMDGKKHQWDGEPLEFGWGSSSTCSKCGALAIEVDAFVAP